MGTKSPGNLLKKLISAEQHVLKHAGISVDWKPGNISDLICKTYLALSRNVMFRMNSTKFANREQLFDLIASRKNRGLLTVSNHSSRLDDPMMWALLTWKNKFNLDNLRWTTAAADVCFTKQVHTNAMAWGKVVPLIRGDGVYQTTMDFCVKLLEAREWLHFFPEGMINLNKENIRLKWGVGRLIAESSVTPIVLPIHHIGFENICLNEGFMKYILRCRNKASIYVGQPLDLTREIEAMKQLKLSVEDMRIKITDRVKEEMLKVEHKAEQFHKVSHGFVDS